MATFRSGHPGSTRKSFRGLRFATLARPGVIKRAGGLVGRLSSILASEVKVVVAGLNLLQSLRPIPLASSAPQGALSL